MKKYIVFTLLFTSSTAFAGIRSYDGQLSEGIHRTGRMAVGNENKPAGNEVPSYAESMLNSWKGSNPNESTARHIGNLWLQGKKFDKEQLDPPAPKAQADGYGRAFVFLGTRFDKETLKQLEKMHGQDNLAVEVYIKEEDAKTIVTDFKKLVDERVKELGTKNPKLVNQEMISQGFFNFSMRPDVANSAGKFMKVSEYPSIVYVAPTGEKRQYPMDSQGFIRFESKLNRTKEAVASGVMSSWADNFLQRIQQR